MFPGRAFLGVGSSEAMNEVPAGMDWPDTAEQLHRTEEALSIIVRLLDGETVDHAGDHFRTRGARLYLRPARRPPIYMSAFHEQAAEVAGRLADGVWTLSSPTTAPAVIAAYRRGAEDVGRAPGEIILQTLASVDATANLVCADPDSHVRTLRLMGAMGASAIVVVNASGRAPEEMIRLYGERVLPQLRGGA